MIVSPSSMQARTRPGISSSASGEITAKGNSTRQSVASVTCETRAKASKRMLSARVCRRSRRRARDRRLPTCSRSRSNSSTARRASPSSSTDACVARPVGRLPAAVDVADAVLQRRDQQAAALAVVEQVVLQVGVAAHHPDVAEHLVEHPGRAAGAALVPQFLDQLPAARAEQAVTISRSESEV
jgi:hypothetical protein